MGVREFFYEVDGPGVRGSVLDALRADGWESEDERSVWDLGRGEVRLLLAVLKVGPDEWKLGIRVLGDGPVRGYFESFLR